MIYIVTKIRFTNPSGAILSVKPAYSNSIHSNKQTVVKVSNKIAAPEFFKVGQFWNFEGAEQVRIQDSNFGKFKEIEITATIAEFVRANDSLDLKSWLTLNVIGFGETKAERLVNDAKDLVLLLDEKDVQGLSRYVTKPIAQRVVEAWNEYGDVATFEFFSEHQIPWESIASAYRFYGKKLVSKVQKDPYILLPFSSFSKIDKVARENFLVTTHDIRRVAAVIENKLIKNEQRGHTFTYASALKQELTAKDRFTAQEVNDAIHYGRKVGAFILTNSDSGLRLSSRGTYFLEQLLATRLKTLAINHTKAKDKPNGYLISKELNDKQIKAVDLAVEKNLALISGVAGAGKTRVIKTISIVYGNRELHLLALSGRACKVMAEATGRDTSTIESFLHRYKDKPLSDNAVVIVDEAAMVGLHTYYRLLKRLPDKSKLVLVGDSYQLPPIEAGLVFQELLSHPLFSNHCIFLDQVMRQSEESSIPSFANKIRQGEWQVPKSDNVTFIPADTRTDMAQKALKTYLSFEGAIQILCPTFFSRAGIDELNELIQSVVSKGQRSISLLDLVTGEVATTKFRVADKIIFTRNDYDRNLFNGSIGKIIEAFDVPQEIELTSGVFKQTRYAVGMCEFEGINHYLFKEDLDAIDLAYAVTVHKAQGSQFDNVLVMVYDSQVVDRSFIYTAVTRAVEKVVVIGSQHVIQNAVVGSPFARRRNTLISEMLSR